MVFSLPTVIYHKYQKLCTKGTHIISCPNEHDATSDWANICCDIRLTYVCRFVYVLFTHGLPVSVQSLYSRRAQGVEIEQECP